MKKIIAGLFISLDGVVESPQTWHFPYFNDEMGAAVGAQVAEADTMLLGRATYQEFAGAFAGADPGDPMAAGMTATPKYVVSTTLESADWANTTLIKDDVIARITELKEGDGKAISVTGSPTLVRTLLRHGLLDELRLLIHPIVVGSGGRLFEDWSDKLPLKVVEAKSFTTGVQAVTYVPAE
jgi:dihydrofolate reductase